MPGTRPGYNSKRRLYPDGRQRGEHADAAARRRVVVEVVEVEQHVAAIGRVQHLRVRREGATPCIRG